MAVSRSNGVLRPSIPLLRGLLMKLPHDQTVFAFWSMMGFLGVLTVGFIYEWKKGALEWE